ncbi:MAG TPA: TIGR03960 family B12-binding radical SAM protein [Candidatus Omnitrophota bacterium]|nr:TIGR03960 family B12-binding radical SAM protein [Candidatus Omnitrophota bacterium]
MDPRLDGLLLTVQKPGRYVGGEWNSIKKDWTPERVKVLLAFPDVYEVGMSNLGISILYGILNGRDDCLCERSFAPWQDFEKVLRENNIPLFSLESRKAIREFDIVGFSVCHELCHTNILNMLDLGGVPVRSCERSENDPLVIAGGPAVYNPEPIAEFIDAFVIGEAEEAVGEIVDACKGRNPRSAFSRRDILKKLAAIPGVYVPVFYNVKYKEDNTINSFLPLDDGIPAVIEKRIVKDLDGAYYPTKQIVPNIGVVHDRIAIEIMRGCKHMCRFCQATVTYRPCRERSRENILRLARESYKNTGHDEISMLSLSSVDFSDIRQMMEDMNREFSPKHVSISVPSLRVEEALKDLPELISKVKKSGLTFAPEAGSDGLRRSINKNIDIARLSNACLESFKSGWRRVKLYFMIGLPRETDKDVELIPVLLKEISSLRKDIDGKLADVTASINAFVPKPHTAFQWEPMDSMDDLERKRIMLRSAVKSRFIELDFHSFKMSYIEAALARGDRRLGSVIYNAWKSGGRFDGWEDFFSIERWKDSFSQNGLDPDFYARRQRPFDEILPWDFIHTGLDRKVIEREALASKTSSFDKPC